MSSLSSPALQPLRASEASLARPCVATAEFRQWPDCFNKARLNPHANKSMFDLQAATSVLGLAFFSSLMLFIPCPIPERVRGAQVRNPGPGVSVEKRRSKEQQ